MEERVLLVDRSLSITSANRTAHAMPSEAHEALAGRSLQHVLPVACSVVANRFVDLDGFKGGFAAGATAACLHARRGPGTQRFTVASGSGAG
jgi:hypothetical protein